MLLQAAKAVSQALNAVVNCLPGTRDVDQAIKTIATASQALQSKEVCDTALVCLCISHFCSSPVLKEKPTKCCRTTSVQRQPA